MVHSLKHYVPLLNNFLKKNKHKSLRKTYTGLRLVGWMTLGRGEGSKLRYVTGTHTHREYAGPRETLHTGGKGDIITQATSPTAITPSATKR